VSISRIDARELAKKGAEMGGRVLRGTLTVTDAHISIDQVNLIDWLAEHNETEVLLIAAPVGRSSTEQKVKSCLTCGRDYSGERCPYCAEARARLRG
jgi:hypothetical protein